MSETPNLDDVIIPEEQAIRDRHAHGKMPAHPNDDALAKRTEQERIAVGIDDYDPDDVPSATE
jgi:hypothetical protein